MHCIRRSTPFSKVSKLQILIEVIFMLQTDDLMLRPRILIRKYVLTNLPFPFWEKLFLEKITLKLKTSNLNIWSKHLQLLNWLTDKKTKSLKQEGWVLVIGKSRYSWPNSVASIMVITNSSSKWIKPSLSQLTCNYRDFDGYKECVCHSKFNCIHIYFRVEPLDQLIILNLISKIITT